MPDASAHTPKTWSNCSVQEGFSAIDEQRKVRRDLSAKLLTLAYPLAVGRLATHIGIGAVTASNEVEATCFPDPMAGLEQVFGDGLFQIVWVFALLGAWAAGNDLRKQRFLLVYTLLIFVFLLNPFIYDYVAQSNFGHLIVWRLYWAIPLPLWPALLLTLPLYFFRDRQRVLKIVSFILIVVLFAGLIPAAYTFSRSNNAWIGWPSLKVPLEDYRTARLVSLHSGPGTSVLIPREIAAWIPTIPQAPDPLLSRTTYLTGLRRYGDPEQSALRYRLWRYVNGRLSFTEAKQSLETAIRSLSLKAVLFRPAQIDHADELISVLTSHGFKKQDKGVSEPFLMYVSTGSTQTSHELP